MRHLFYFIIALATVLISLFSCSKSTNSSGDDSTDFNLVQSAVIDGEENRLALSDQSVNLTVQT